LWFVRRGTETALDRFRKVALGLEADEFAVIARRPGDWNGSFYPVAFDLGGDLVWLEQQLGIVA
jgi:hypothetical protein